MNKYTLTNNTKQWLGHTLYQIQALKDFGSVKAGELGGWVEKESNLSQEGLCWVFGNARVSGDAWVYGNARVYDNALVYGDARVFGNAKVSGYAKVFGKAKVYGDAWVYGNAQVFGNAKVYGNARVSGYARVYGNAQVFGNAWVYGNARVFGNARVSGDAWVYGNALVYGNARVYDNALVYGDARVYGNAQVFGNAKVYGDAWVYGNALVYGDAQVFGNAKVSGYARVSGDARVYDNALVYGNARVYGNAQVSGDAKVYGLSIIPTTEINPLEIKKKEPLVLNKKEPVVEKTKLFTYTKLPTTYSEEHQPNPLKWCLLEKTKENTYKNISNWFVCKDFFNDLVVAIHNKMFFTKYGFSVENKPIPKKDTCLYVALDKTKKAFLANLKTLPLPNRLTVKVVDGVVILRIPAYYHKNTYRISLLTLLVRLCNVNDEIDVLKTTPSNEKDKSLWEQINHKLFAALPDTVKYTWYVSAVNNSETNKTPNYTTTSLIHNNGILSWKNSGLLQ